MILQSQQKMYYFFFCDYIGPYAYEKLANIESPVVSGGIKAASAIGYSDKLITGDRPVRTF